jgi:hypothetical protein
MKRVRAIAACCLDFALCTEAQALTTASGDNREHLLVLPRDKPGFLAGFCLCDNRDQANGFRTLSIRPV